MHTPEGRWVWMAEVVKEIEERAFLEPPYQPDSLVRTTPDYIREHWKEEGVLPLLHVWQRWVSDSLRVEHSNTLNLRTLLCCYGIAREWVELAKEDKAHVVRGMVEKITAFLQESWGLPENEVMSSLLNVDLFARRFASIHASSYMNKEWASVPYVVRQ